MTEKEEKLKKYTIWYIFGQGEDDVTFFDCDEYIGTTEDIPSAGGEVVSFPMILGINKETSSGEKIPAQNIVSISVNFGIEEELGKKPKSKKKHVDVV